MHSIQAKTTLLTVCAIVVAMTVATLIGVIAIKNVGDSSSEKMLLLLCQTGEKNPDYYFESVEQSVEMVSTYVKSDIESIEMDDFAAHIQRVRKA